MKKTIEQLREETYQETMNLLQTYKKACIIRPTGFGKTGILTRCIHQFQQVLYLYPAEVIKDTVLGFYHNNTDDNTITTIENVTFMTYAKLIRLTEKDYAQYKNIDLIIADECHKLGANQTSRALKKLLQHLPDVNLLGATATPDRMDLIDEVELFFENHVTSEYTLHQAFQDQILTKPYYCFCSYGTQDLSFVENQSKLDIEKMTHPSERAYASDLLRSRLIEISNLANMSNIIRDTCDQYIPDTSYLKFIVFFSSFQHIHDQKEQVTKWYQDAYPTHTICPLIVSSETKSYRDNVNQLMHQKRTEQTIDLIFCCDMLNLGYHVNDMNGIFMYRGTSSGIIFAQQLGRILSSGHQHTAIVFDAVDNIHRKALYDVLGQQSAKTIKKQTRYQELVQKCEDLTQKLSDQEQKELHKLQTLFNRENHWWTHANDLQPQDLIATGHEATYRELIAKTVAEPISMRCRQAWARWIEKGGDPSVLTKTAILSQNVPNGVPLSPFCKLKQVSIQAVLMEMGVK